MTQNRFISKKFVQHSGRYQKARGSKYQTKLTSASFMHSWTVFFDSTAVEIFGKERQWPSNNLMLLLF